MLSSGWELSNNARTWTINLRQNIPWHGDNGDFSSADVIHSLERAVDPEVSVFSYIARFPQLDGTPGSTVQSIEAVDDHSVRFEIDFPYVRLFKALAGSEGLFMTSKKHFDKVGADGYSTDPVGTGPYDVQGVQVGRIQPLGSCRLRPLPGEPGIPGTSVDLCRRRGHPLRDVTNRRSSHYRCG